MAKFQIGTIEFPTKGAAKKAVQEVLWRYKPGDTLSQEDGQFIYYLLWLHPSRDQKIGVGVASIKVEKHPCYDTQGFYITRVDGSRTDFSYLECLNPSTPEAKVKAALRFHVADQILDFKNSRAPICEATGVGLIGEEAHVDHWQPTFEQLVKSFCVWHDISLTDLVVLPSQDNEFWNKLADPDAIQAWQDYHRQHAVLRLVHKSVNLSRKNP